MADLLIRFVWLCVGLLLGVGLETARAARHEAVVTANLQAIAQAAIYAEVACQAKVRERPAGCPSPSPERQKWTTPRWGKK